MPFLFEDALEELCLEGFEGSTVRSLCNHLSVRNPSRADLYRTETFAQQCYEALISHSGVSVKGSEKAPSDCRRNQNEPGGAVWDTDVLVASRELIFSTLNLWCYPTILESEIRQAIILALARRRYEGYWQFALARDLGCEPKVIFQHLKPLYKYNLIVRFALAVPGDRRMDTSEFSATALSSSGVLWYSRFFDLTRIPRDLIHVYLTQQITPFRTAVSKLLREQPDHILLEKDFRTYFLTFFLSSESRDQFVCSMKTIARFYRRMRKDLVQHQIIKRVRAWCPQTARIELCIILHEHYEADIRSSGGDQDQFRVINEADEDEGEEDEEVFSTKDELPFSSSTVPSVSASNLTVRTPEEDECDGEDASTSLTGVSISKQVLAILREVGREGIVTPDLAAYLHTTTKRLSKVLSILENAKLVVKKAQRVGKYFMYRYFMPGLMEQPKALPEMRGDATVTAAIDAAHPGPSRKRGGSIDGRSASRKTLTEQFVTRLTKFIDFVVDSKVCMIPDISRALGQLEGTPHGPDRRTILRLSKSALDKSPNLKSGTFIVGAKGTQKLMFFYDSNAFETENAAAVVVARHLSDKRSEACRDAVRRNTESLSQIKGEESTLPALTAAVEDMNEKIERWGSSSNPINKYGAQNGAILADIQVEPRLDEIVPITNRHAVFSQRLLAHYGFLFPVMIRLKLFHAHVLKLSETYPVMTLDTVIREMTIETFLRVIGCGYHNVFLEGYLHGSTPRCPDLKVKLPENKELRMKEIPPDVFTALVTSHKPHRSAALPYANTRRTATIAAHRLMSKLSALRVVQEVPSLPGESGEGGWTVFTEANIYTLVAHPGETLDVVATFKLDEDHGFDNYWRCLRGTVEDWTRRHTNKGDDSETAYPYNLPLPEAFSKKNWKGQMLLSTEARAELDRLARKILARAEASECLKAPQGSTLSILNPQSPEIMRYAAALRMSPDAVIQYLVRFFSTAGNSRLCRIALGKVGNLAIHPSRDIRYSCHLCKIVYAQRPSIVSHYHSIHNMSLPVDERVYTLPAELERRKRRIRHETFRRKRRRKVFGAESYHSRGTEDDDFLGDQRRRHQKHVAQLLSCISSGDALSEEEEEECDENPGSGIATQLRLPASLDAWKSMFRESWRSELPDNEALAIAELAFMSSDEEDEGAAKANPIKIWEDQGVPSTTDQSPWKQRFGALSTKGQEVLSLYRLTKRQRSQVKRFIQEARRDDEYFLIAYLVVVERLRKSLEVNDIIPPGKNVQTALEGLPLLTDPLWDLFSCMKPGQFRSPAAAYFVSQYCLHRSLSSLNFRLFSTYRRLTGRDLNDNLMTFNLPVRMEIRDTHPFEFVMTNHPDSITASDRMRLLMGRAAMKQLLLTPWSRFRQGWGATAMQTLSDSEVQMVWSFFNKCGYSVFSKRTTMGSGLPEKNSKIAHPFPLDIVNFWESISRRRYCLSRGMQAVSLGRLRPWNNAVKRRLAMTALETVETEDSFPLQTNNVCSAAVGAAIEATATGLIDIGVSWTQSESATWIADPWEGLEKDVELSDEAQPDLKAAFVTAITAPALVEEDTDDILDGLVDDADEDDSDDEEEDLDAEDDDDFFDKPLKRGTGVQEHITKLTGDAPDVEQFWWKTCENRQLPRHAAVLLLCETIELAHTLCGMDSETEGAVLDPWLLPIKLGDGQSLATAESHRAALFLERNLEFEDDFHTKWLMPDREERYKTGQIETTKRVKRARRRTVIPCPSASDPLPVLSMIGAPSRPNAQFWETLEKRVILVRGQFNVKTHPNTLFERILDLSHLGADAWVHMDDSATMSFLTSLIWLHTYVARAVTGVYQYDLKKSFCSEFISKYETHSACHRDLDLALVILRTLRAVIFVPGDSDWFLTTPSRAHTLPTRIVRQHRDLVKIKEAVISAGVDMSNKIRLSRTDWNLLQTAATDDVKRPPFIPKGLWKLYGTPLGSAFFGFGVYQEASGHNSNDGEVNVTAPLPADLLAAYERYCKWDLARLNFLQELQQEFANLRSAMALNSTIPETDKPLFMTTAFLSVSESPLSVWKSLDGRANNSLLALTISRVYQILLDSPGSTVLTLHQRLKFLDLCELKELCDCMVAEGFITSQPIPFDTEDTRSRVVPKSGISIARTTELMLTEGSSCCTQTCCYAVRKGAGK
eukprot:Blabericola_migrator_1__9630@NODE_525_length_7848_cov_108_451227_g401_i0_p1_GENE_NODE_525_length_7848_cov_108_451227_g401_i0NODE_525_length_7848_cov_108_451227_g401_i0_p1_ORF_typecomplete_len2157_score324_22Bblock_TFIIIC/PF04182_12/2_4e14Bblock_TFIIIC/PF04182_12/2_4e03Bblock_TFIIIC/PF04182_12/0_027MarR/PF01047_22/20MarR/PF01047_22/0_31MarR/PF01047_22/5_6e03HTH_20/PF12840_7/1_3e02HTH_20/PF12840_7/0_41RNA_pol_Rpc34/PF05158_12/3_8e03RNA_pol_Rpc34/PF05158_12/0_048HTH_34/PF13601_6/1_7e03HTH_34/PF1360